MRLSVLGCSKMLRAQECSHLISTAVAIFVALSSMYAIFNEQSMQLGISPPQESIMNTLLPTTIPIRCQKCRERIFFILSTIIRLLHFIFSIILSQAGSHNWGYLLYPQDKFYAAIMSALLPMTSYKGRAGEILYYSFTAVFLQVTFIFQIRFHSAVHVTVDISIHRKTFKPLPGIPSYQP